MHGRDKQAWLLEYNIDACDRELKLGHSYKTHNVDLCHTDANLSIATTIQMWIHARYKKLHCNLWKRNERFKHIPRVFISSSTKYDSILEVITCSIKALTYRIPLASCFGGHYVTPKYCH